MIPGGGSGADRRVLMCGFTVLRFGECYYRAIFCMEGSSLYRTDLTEDFDC